MTVDTTGAACGNTVVSADSTRFPRNQTEGDIPKFAVATGSVDQVECVLRKVGVDASEFTNPSGGGRIQFYEGDGSVIDPPARPRTSGGAVIDSTTPAESVLMSDPATLSSYDVLMLPCEGGDFPRPAAQLSNLVNFANAGGRIYSSHFAYSWLWTNVPFNTVASWTGNQAIGTYDSDTATVDTTFAAGKTLYNWLQLPAINASSSPGEITVNTIKHDFNGIDSTINQSWLTLNVTGNPVMQFVFDTPVGQKTGQCGRVLFNEYHVENGASGGATFPTECSGGAMTPQEKLLEYSLFELTDDGGQGSISPTSLDFGSVPVGITSPAQTVTFTNNSTFQTTVSLVNTTGDFTVSNNGCTAPVKGGASCAVAVTFTATALGARTGTLNIGSGAQTLTATLTGNGIPDLTLSASSLDFGSVDVGASTNRTFTINNTTATNISMPALAVSGDFSATSNCGASIAANSSCVVTVKFSPTVYGPRTGTLISANTAAAYALLNVALTGNGLDFSMAMSPASGSVIAGRGASPTATLTPLAGFSYPVTVTCTTNAPGSTCSLSTAGFSPAAATPITVSITTTSQYTVIGYGGMGEGWLALFGFCGVSLLWMKRKQARVLIRCGMFSALLIVSGSSLTGCGNLKPAANGNPTSAGTYTYTVQATDGTITHATTYSLTVTSK